MPPTNAFLIKFASRMPEIRRLMNWTQNDLSQRTGISRATIINFEKYPSRLTKHMAIASAAVILHELVRRHEYLDKNAHDANATFKNMESCGLAAKTVMPILPDYIDSLPKVPNYPPAKLIRELPDYFTNPHLAPPFTADISRIYIMTTIEFIIKLVCEQMYVSRPDVNLFIVQLEAAT